MFPAHSHTNRFFTWNNKQFFRCIQQICQCYSIVFIFRTADVYCRAQMKLINKQNIACRQATIAFCICAQALVCISAKIILRKFKLVMFVLSAFVFLFLLLFHEARNAINELYNMKAQQMTDNNSICFCVYGKCLLIILPNDIIQIHIFKITV